MKKIVLILVLPLILMATSIKEYEFQLSHLSEEQTELRDFVAYNAKKYDLEKTMVAICFIESQFGKYKLNLSDPSAGAFHKLLSMYAMELKLSPTKWNQSRLAEKLINNNALAFHVAMEQFLNDELHWKTLGYSKSVSWKRSVMSYNAGVSNWMSGKRYYKEVVKIIKAYKLLKKNGEIK